MTSRSPRLLALGGAALSAAALLFVSAIADGSYDLVDRQAVAVVLWWLVGLTALVTSRRPVRPAVPGLLVIGFGAGMALWIAVNLGASISEERSVTELGRMVTHLAPVVLIGWALPARLWRGVFVGLLLGAVAVCAAALGNRLSPGFLGQTDAIVFTEMTSRMAAPLGYWNAVGSWGVVTGLLLLAVSAHAARGWERALALAPLPLAVTVVYLTYSRSSIGAALVGLVVLVALSKHRWTLVLHSAAAALAGLVAVSVVSGADQIAQGSGTQGGGKVVAVVVVAGLVLAAVAWAAQRFGLDRVALPRRAAQIALAAGAVVAVVVGGVAVAQRGQEAWDKFSKVENTDQASDPTKRLATLSNGYRVAQWRVALDSWKDEKAHGSGAGTFELTYNLHAEDTQFVRDAHSAFLEALSEQGTLGLLLLVGFVGSIAAAVVTAVRRAGTAVDRGHLAGAGAALAAFVFGTAFDWFWEVSALALLALGLVGVVIAAGKPGGYVVAVDGDGDAVADGDGDADAAGVGAADAAGAPAATPVAVDDAPRGGGWVARSGLVATALLAVLVLLPGLVGTSEVRRSQADVAAGDLAAARAHADEAIGIQPWASSPFLQRGLVDEQDGQWASARRALQLAIARDRYDWRLPLVLARIEAKAGEPEAAIKAYREAKRLRPKGQFFQ